MKLDTRSLTGSLKPKRRSNRPNPLSDRNTEKDLVSHAQPKKDSLTEILEMWLVDGAARGLSEKTLRARRRTIGQLLWWMREEKRDHCGPAEIRGFLAYVAEPHTEGRWEGRPGRRPTRTAAAKPVTANSYYCRLRTFFRWAIEQDYLAESPIKGVRAPIYHPDQIVPFSEAQVQAILRAAGESRYPERDEAIAYLLLDTGLRASELLSLKSADIDLAERQAIVMGKGRKTRPVNISRTTANVYQRYLTTVDDHEGMPVFLSEKGGSLTLSGLEQIVERLGEAAGVHNVRCSPHTFRHTFAVMFLRAGGHVFALKEMLGHESLAMTMRYAQIAQADVRAQHAQYSPVESLRGGRR